MRQKKRFLRAKGHGETEEDIYAVLCGYLEFLLQGPLHNLTLP